MEVQMSTARPEPRQIPVTHLADNAESALRHVRWGERVALTSRGKVVAYIVPADPAVTEAAGAGSWFDFVDAFREATDLVELDVDGAFRDVRDRSLVGDFRL